MEVASAPRMYGRDICLGESAVPFKPDAIDILLRAALYYNAFVMTRVLLAPLSFVVMEEGGVAVFSYSGAGFSQICLGFGSGGTACSPQAGACSVRSWGSFL